MTLGTLSIAGFWLYAGMLTVYIVDGGWSGDDEPPNAASFSDAITAAPLPVDAFDASLGCMGSAESPKRAQRPPGGIFPAFVRSGEICTDLSDGMRFCVPIDKPKGN